MKTILFVINTFGVGGGAEKALLELLNQINYKEYEVHLYVLTGQGDLIAQLPGEVKLLNKRYFPISVLDHKGKVQLMKTAAKAMIVRGTILKRAGYLAKNLVDMIKAGEIRMDKLLWKILSDGAQRLDMEYDLAVAYLEGGSTYYISSHVKAKKKAAFIHIDYTDAGYNRKLDEECYLSFHHIFTVSESVRKAFVLAYPECIQKTTVLYNLINREKIIDKSMEAGGFPDNYDGFRILTVGRLVPQKAISMAINTMKILKKTGKPFRWYVLGEGELRKELQEQIYEMGLEEDFFLLGMKENPYPYYAQCDLYAHTAHYEGMSVAIEEAQVLGCAIVAVEYHGVQEQIIDGIDGRISKFDPEVLAENIIDLFDHPKQMHDYAAAASEKEQPDHRKEVEKLLKLIL